MKTTYFLMLGIDSAGKPRGVRTTSKVASSEDLLAKAEKSNYTLASVPANLYNACPISDNYNPKLGALFASHENFEQASLSLKGEGVDILHRPRLRVLAGSSKTEVAAPEASTRDNSSTNRKTKEDTMNTTTIEAPRVAVKPAAATVDFSGLDEGDRVRVRTEDGRWTNATFHKHFKTTGTVSVTIGDEKIKVAETDVKIPNAVPKANTTAPVKTASIKPDPGIGMEEGDVVMAKNPTTGKYEKLPIAKAYSGNKFGFNFSNGKFKVGSADIKMVSTNKQPPNKEPQMTNRRTTNTKTTTKQPAVEKDFGGRSVANTLADTRPFVRDCPVRFCLDGRRFRTGAVFVGKIKNTDNVRIALKSGKTYDLPAAQVRHEDNYKPRGGTNEAATEPAATQPRSKFAANVGQKIRLADNTIGTIEAYYTTMRTYMVKVSEPPRAKPRYVPAKRVNTLERGTVRLVEVA